MLSAKALQNNGLSAAEAQAVANATAGFTWQQWLALIQAILSALGPILGGLGGIGGGTPAKPTP